MKSNFLYLILFAFGLANVASAQMGKIDTSHISDKSFCVVRLDVKRILSQVKNPKKILKTFAEELRRDAKIDFFSINCMTFQFGDTDIWDGAPSFALTMEFAKDIDQESIIETVSRGADYREVTQNGKKYLKPETEDEPYFYFQSKRKFTLATPGAIKAILVSGGGMGDIASRIKSTPPGSEFLAVFQKTEKFEDSVTDVYREFGALVNVLDLEQLLEKAHTGLAFMNLTSGKPLYLQLTVDSEQSAESLKTDLKSLMTLGKSSLPAAKALLKMEMKKLNDAGLGEKGDQLSNAGKWALGVGLYSLDLAEKILAAATCQTKGKMVWVEVKHMGGLKEIADLAASGLALLFNERFQDGEEE